MLTEFFETVPFDHFKFVQTNDCLIELLVLNSSI